MSRVTFEGKVLTLLELSEQCTGDDKNVVRHHLGNSQSLLKLS